MASWWLCCLAGAGLSLVPSTTRGAEGAEVERWVLIDGRTLGAWAAVESTLSASGIGGEEALLFRVPVDWSSGERNYPVGWPRLEMSVPDGARDWRRWEQLWLRVYAPAEGDPLPREPLGIALRTGDQHSFWERGAEGLRRGEWREFAFDLSDVPDPDRVHSMTIFVSEEDYPDGATLRFYLSKLELVRYLKPTLGELASVPSVAFADASALLFGVKMFGLPAGRAAELEVMLTRGDAVVAHTTARVMQGRTAVTLPLPGATSPGEYALVARSGKQERRQEIRLVASPWQEAAQ